MLSSFFHIVKLFDASLHISSLFYIKFCDKMAESPAAWLGSTKCISEFIMATVFFIILRRSRPVFWEYLSYVMIISYSCFSWPDVHFSHVLFSGGAHTRKEVKPFFQVGLHFNFVKYKHQTFYNQRNILLLLRIFK